MLIDLFDVNGRYICSVNGCRLGADTVVTARHAIEQAATAAINCGPVGCVPVDGVMFEDEFADLIKLKVTALPPSIAVAKLQSVRPSVGSAVQCHTFSSSGMQRTLSGHIEKRERRLGKVYFGTTLAGKPGMSGSCVFNDQGELVGILVGAEVAGVESADSILVSSIESLKPTDFEEAVPLNSWRSERNTPEFKRANALMARGRQYLDLSQWQEAETCFAEASGLLPRDRNPVRWRMLALYRNGKLNDSLLVASKFLEANADDGWMWLLYGHSLMRAGRLPEATDAYDRAATTGCGSEPHYWKAVVLYRRGLSTDAQNAAERAVKENPTDVESLSLIAQIMTERGLADAARMRLRLCEIEPENMEFVLELAQSYLRFNEENELKLLIERYRIVNPVVAARIAQMQQLNR